MGAIKMLAAMAGMIIGFFVCFTLFGALGMKLSEYIDARSETPARNGNTYFLCTGMIGTILVVVLLMKIFA